LLQAQALGITAVGLLEIARLRRAGLVGLARPVPARLRSLLGRGLPALGLTVGLTVVLRADRYLLGAVSGTAAVGIYSLSATLSEVSRILPASLGQLYLRDASTGHAAARLSPTVHRALLAAMAGGLIVATGGWFLIVPIFGTEFAPARDLLLLLAAAEVCLAPYAVASRGLLGGGWTKAAGALGIGGGVVAIAVYGVSATAAGAAGVAAGSLVVYAGLSAVSLRMLRRRIVAQPEKVGNA
jgi:O-antigen/teichoic acid export membrane protein